MPNSSPAYGRPAVLTALTEPEPPAHFRRLAWLASAPDGSPVGSAFLRLPADREHGGPAELRLNVHPADRRRGVGSRLLAAALAAAGEDDRRSVLSEAGDGSPADHFLAARGFRRALTLTHARLALTHPATTAGVSAPGDRPGYRLVSWDGTVPGHLAESFTAAHSAMDDMPLGDTGQPPVHWDVRRVRAVAEAVADRGDLLHTVAAADVRDGTIVAFTELVVPGDGTGEGQHYGTGVLPAHRGHGIGRWIKAESVRLARQRYPALAGLITDTADGNAPMRAINDSLGYEQTHRSFTYRYDLH